MIGMALEELPLWGNCVFRSLNRIANFIPSTYIEIVKTCLILDMTLWEHNKVNQVAIGLRAIVDNIILSLQKYHAVQDVQTLAFEKGIELVAKHH